MNQTNASMIDRARQQRPFFEPIGQPSRWQVLMDKIRVLAPTRGFAKPLRAVGAIARSIAGMIVGAVTLGSLVACVEAVVFDAVGPGMSVGHEIANLDRDETGPIAGELTETRSMWVDRTARKGPSALAQSRRRAKAQTHHGWTPSIEE